MGYKMLLPILQVFSALASSSILIPRPSGPLGTDVKIVALTDYSRMNPFAPKPEYRSMVISIFSPVAPVDECKWTAVPAFPAKAAAVFNSEVAMFGVPKGTFERIQMQFCDTTPTLRAKSIPEAPVVMFSPGLGLSRLWYSALAQAVASLGFNVITVDLPYDADVVEFPDGKVILAINSTWDPAQSLQDVRVRSQDISFVIDQLSNASRVNDIFPGEKIKFQTERVGIYGHSIGGAAAAQSMYTDPRIIGGVNLDGGLYGPAIQKGLKNPFVLFAHKSNSTSDTWVKIWPHLNWKLDIELRNSTHTSFTDIPLLADLIL